METTSNDTQTQALNDQPQAANLTLIQKLFALQGELGLIKRGGQNPHFGNKYATLPSVLAEVIPQLQKYGLYLNQKVFSDAAGLAVETVIYDTESGESMSGGPLYVPASKKDPQGQGSALTYARRYSLMAMLGISQEDDDAERARRAAEAEMPLPEKAQKVLIELFVQAGGDEYEAEEYVKTLKCGDWKRAKAEAETLKARFENAQELGEEFDPGISERALEIVGA